MQFWYEPLVKIILLPRAETGILKNLDWNSKWSFLRKIKYTLDQLRFSKNRNSGFHRAFTEHLGEDNPGG